jgi:hypothetical protein
MIQARHPNPIWSTVKRKLGLEPTAGTKLRLSATALYDDCATILPLLKAARVLMSERIVLARPLVAIRLSPSYRLLNYSQHNYPPSKPTSSIQPVVFTWANIIK